ncbi:MAG: histidinol-phosphatase HisJ [Parcubacteria group bacterium]|nr:histidinol-phosphatase HisJ [Parcubacteria group bacterium]
MKLTNYHTHSKYSDGKSSLEEHVQKAIDLKMHSLGFSDHAPFESSTLPWHMKESLLNSYLNEAERLKEKYRDKLDLYTGLEIDYIEGMNRLAEFKNLDYKIGSVHYLGRFKNEEYYGFDHNKEGFEKGLEKIYSGDIKKLVKTYYETTSKMLLEDKPDIVGHVDLIKKFNKGNIYFNENEKWYREEIYKCLNVLAKSGCIMEINTRGLYRGHIETFYPSSFIIKKAFELNIPVTISVDAHNINDLCLYFDEAVKMLKEIGYENISVLEKGIWVERRL